MARSTREKFSLSLLAWPARQLRQLANLGVEKVEKRGEQKEKIQKGMRGHRKGKVGTKNIKRKDKEGHRIRRWKGIAEKEDKGICLLLHRYTDTGYSSDGELKANP